MTESRVAYRVNVLKPDENSGMMTTELDTMRAHLPDLERQLLSLLVTVQRAMGKEPIVLTRRERRKE